MLKNQLEIFYKVFYNFHLKKDGIESRSYLLACCATGVFVFVSILNIFCVLSISFHLEIPFKISKPGNWLFTIIFMTGFYYFIFNILKFEKTGDREDLFFTINPGVSKKVFWIYAINFLLFFVLAILRKHYLN